MHFRRATPTDCVALSALARRSKQHWGYDETFMEQCGDELDVRPADMETDVIFVLEEGHHVVGFYALTALELTVLELDKLFVEPTSIGLGAGRRLIAHARETAKRLGAERIVIASDPHAAGFYERMGAKRIGERTSESVAGRLLPLLELAV